MGKNDKGLSDPRFKHVKSDPKFGGLKRKERKVVLDDRFGGALTDTRFTRVATVDKRGRKVKKTTDTTLHHIYDIEENEKNTVEKKKKKKKDEVIVKNVDEDEEDDDNEDSHVDLGEIRYDLARGDGANISFSSDDEESGSEWELEEEEEEHGWGELDKDARRVEWASRRLAICNLDWDSLHSEDLFMLVSSFKPLGGKVDKLTIYLSDLGKEKLAKEDEHGPDIDISIKSTSNEVDDNDDENIDEESLTKNPKTREAVRKYQVERLKYYYAVLECDNEQTASVVYEHCDGVEYENSGLRLDLRFVPDDMTFDESRIKECITVNDVQPDKYKPREVANSALSLSRVKLTWEDSDENRARKIKEAFDENADLDIVSKELIAPDEDDEDDMNSGGLSKKERLAILLGATEEDGDNIEIEWQNEDEKKTKKDKIESKKNQNKEKSNKSTWETYLDKRKMKRKERKANIAELKKKAREEREVEDNVKEDKKKKIKETSKNKIDKDDIQVDDRFKALFTDSAFTIDQSTGLAKNKGLLEKQNSARQKRKATFDKEVNEDSQHALIAKLKKKSAKWSS